jgi:hypothetical protein
MDTIRVVSLIRLLLLEVLVRPLQQLILLLLLHLDVLELLVIVVGIGPRFLEPAAGLRGVEAGEGPSACCFIFRLILPKVTEAEPVV